MPRVERLIRKVRGNNLKLWGVIVGRLILYLSPLGEISVDRPSTNSILNVIHLLKFLEFLPLQGEID